jgi:hypothetical protein
MNSSSRHRIGGAAGSPTGRSRKDEVFSTVLKKGLGIALVTLKKNEFRKSTIHAIQRNELSAGPVVDLKTKL